jgi:hypothetical protein
MTVSLTTTNIYDNCGLRLKQYYVYLSFNLYKRNFAEEDFQLRQLFSWGISTRFWHDAASLNIHFSTFRDERSVENSGIDYPETRCRSSE